MDLKKALENPAESMEEFLKGWTFSAMRDGWGSKKIWQKEIIVTLKSNSQTDI